MATIHLFHPAHHFWGAKLDQGLGPRKLSLELQVLGIPDAGISHGGFLC